MRASKFFISTLKEAPSEAEVISHKLMLRAGSAVVGLWNEAFDLDGRPPGDGTTVPGVQRARRFRDPRGTPRYVALYALPLMIGALQYWLVRKGFFKRGENVVFLHTGGQVGLFGYRQFLTGAAA